MIGNVKVICFYGPESTGKTFMARRMAQVFKTTWVPEVAREMISSNNFTAEDIVRIGKAQTLRVLEEGRRANRIVFCDTDVITTQIYAREYLQAVPAILYALEKIVTYDHYFLFHPDVPWVADGLRDLYQKREEMFHVFKSELEKRKIPYTNVQGTYAAREKFLIDQVTATFLTLPTR